MIVDELLCVQIQRKRPVLYPLHWTLSIFARTLIPVIGIAPLEPEHILPPAIQNMMS